MPEELCPYCQYRQSACICTDSPAPTDPRDPDPEPQDDMRAMAQDIYDALKAAWDGGDDYDSAEAEVAAKLRNLRDLAESRGEERGRRQALEEASRWATHHAAKHERRGNRALAAAHQTVSLVMKHAAAGAALSESPVSPETKA